LPFVVEDPLTQQREKIKVDISFFCFSLPSLSIALLPPPFNLPAETARKWSCLFVEKLLGKIKKFVGGKKKGHYIEEAQIADLIDAAGV
jgi:hypothetical protein